MADEPAYLKNFKALTRANPTNEHTEALEEEMYSSSSDRAVAVLLASFVETNLATLLRSVVRDDLNSDDRKLVFGFEGALGTFGARIVMAYALKLIGPMTRADLDLVRHLRNGFAHGRVPLTFRAAEVKAVCDQFKVLELPGNTGVLPYKYKDRIPPDKPISDLLRDDPRTRFIATCHHISYQMHMKCVADPSLNYQLP